MSAPPDNPYATPTARVADIPVQARFGSPLKAVVLGWAAGIGLSVASGIVLAILYSVAMISAGADTARVIADMRTVTPTSPLGFATMIINVLCAMFSGYLCARIAKRNEHLLGVMLGAIGLVFGLIFVMAAGVNGLALTSQTASFLGVVGGAHLGAVRNRRPLHLDAQG